ncbi:formimidoylglutamase [Rhodococcus sp. NPDC127528]|uniref:formimidoylglutamase n=1 Tax=unclassified Rhodococcus (in: high G+C Gram-positive bacteria) TaxID=192944 RepID=UPI0036335E13
MSGIDIAPRPWSGREDGVGPEHLRWHAAVTPLTADSEPGACVLVGFRSDEGVRRNQGRPGAVRGPVAARHALSSLALAEPLRILDAGDIAVRDGDLEDAQRRLGVVIAGLLDAGHFVTVLGGGHEVAYGSYLGIAGSSLLDSGARLGVLNLDAHFDLRADPVASSGTPFRQIADSEAERGRSLRYAVLGIAQPSNTPALFGQAASVGARFLLDEECTAAKLPAVESFVHEFLGAVDVVHLSIDLDVLPAAIAPGVSAPAGFGVPVEVIAGVCETVARSGALAVLDVAELNPRFDYDNRTALTAARLIHHVVSAR